MKRRTKKFIVSLVLTLSCLLITTLIIQIPNPCFENVGSKDAWISFFGSVAGGLLTITGVIWSLEAQENQRREDLAIQYKPLLSLIDVFSSKSKEEHIFTTQRDIYYGSMVCNNSSYAAENEKYKNDNYIGLVFNNIGRGQIENCVITDVTTNDNTFFENSIFWDFRANFADLMVGEKSAIIIHFPIYTPLYANNIVSPFYYSLKITIRYTDEFNINKYKYEVYVSLKIKYELSEYLVDDLDKTPVVRLGYAINSIMPKLTKVN